MNAELIAVGTEILLGEIVNTDAQAISQGLSELGINVFYQTVVGDNPDRLRDVVENAKARADIIITTGGLGPTLDDLTKETLATVFGKKMALHQPSLDRIVGFFRDIGREMTKNNEKQAWLPEGCTVFVNEWGTAPGCAFEADGKHVLMLPGPPRECDPMWRECAMPYLYKLAGGVIVSHNVRVIGLGESAMEDKLHDMMERMTNPTIAPYAKISECFARITAKADTVEEAEAMLAPVVREVCDILGDDVYGVDVDSLEQVVGDGLKARGMTLSVAESCTGGLLSKRITDVPGCSAYYLGGVCSYSNAVKMNILGVRKETLDTVGAVSPEVAEQMAAGVAKALGTDVGVGITGIAGPDGGTEEKPVGLVYISVYHNGKVVTRKMQSRLGRDRVRNQAASTALDLVRRQVLADNLKEK
ncbi:MAG: competence/damage-inducible protein A [Intestinibacillus sp.]